jgi:hypothetical protein
MVEATLRSYSTGTVEDPRAGIPTVVTGPRGFGKTMLFRRLSERLIIECGCTNSKSASGVVSPNRPARAD